MKRSSRSKLVVVWIFGFLIVQTAKVAIAQPLDCFFKDKAIGSDITRYVRNGTVICKDQDTQKVAKEVEVKSGKIMSEKKYSDGIIQTETSWDGDPNNNNYHGWRKEYENGKLAKETLYNHGNELTEKAHFPNGKLKYQTAYNEKDRNVKSRVEYDEQGLLVGLECSPAVIDEKHKELCGYVKGPSKVVLYSHGKPFETLTYDQGKPTSTEQVTGDGVKQKTRTAAKGNILGVETDYFPNGKKRSEIRVNASGQTDGVQKFFFKDSGTVASEEVYDKGALLETRIFYRNGQIMRHFKWNPKIINKRRYGSFEEFYDTGTKKSAGECYVKANQLWEGGYESYYTMELSGIYTEWNEESVLRQKTAYKDGYREGVSEIYDVYGKSQKCLRKVTYQKGNPIKVQSFRDENGSWALVGEGEFLPDGSRKQKTGLSMSKLMYGTCEKGK
jgi:antitoxin component YwqK of YwqJK toxin-antitoxin module